MLSELVGAGYAVDQYGTATGLQMSEPWMDVIDRDDIPSIGRSSRNTRRYLVHFLVDMLDACIFYRTLHLHT